jgi:hypothetical protein
MRFGYIDFMHDRLLFFNEIEVPGHRGRAVEVKP